MARKAKQTVEVVKFTGGQIKVDEGGTTLGITGLSAYPKTEKQADFVIANVSVSMQTGVQIKGIKVLRSKFEGKAPYLEIPGYTVEGKRFHYVQLPQNVKDYISTKVTAVLA